MSFMSEDECYKSFVTLIANLLQNM